MGDARFPSLEYAHDIAEETQERIQDTEYRVETQGTPEPEMDWVELQKPESEDSVMYNPILVLLMNADERYHESVDKYETRPNYQFFDDARQENVIDECERIDTARNKWFDLLEEIVSDSS